ncbi:cytochrome b/b6 domain-containing protein [Thiothrix subterranea]|uniref:Cytochrome b/b6 domain-containing protein n=1 Tax=Thiothrix subterranea TaxID=2735563 RepID=A0AA51ML00_9GAMM|nr:cytochrome b/b6 domain-containing protein [Thiothrix subterranea]MDQ5768967.1 cytochrome b/b6 domain-containing protein [Thiothrix subterranea]WML86118.1 cytochrome b/b6 domain-containing protein [Thiothrix subterranea]
MQTTPVKLWDLPTRLFHWTLVIGIGFSWFCAEIGGNWMVWHERSGIFLLALVLFRVVWGFIGSDTAQFRQFLTSPVQALAHLRDWRSRATAFHAGHNPLGAWMVVVLLLAVLAQAATGLFATDDIMTEGPLIALVSGSTAEWLTSIHHFSFNSILLLAGIHIAAVFFYRFYKRTNLVKAMVVGKADWPTQQPLPVTLVFKPAWLGVLVFAMIYAGVASGIAFLAQ